MKKILLALLLVLLITGAAFSFTFNKKSNGGLMDKKVLVAYYSLSGNTKAVAEKIKDVTNADMFEIVPVDSYPTDYNELVKQAKKEKEKNVILELKDNGNVEPYDVIFIGTPVWWYTFATPIKTFLKENNFDGKIVVPFCTHGGGGASSTYTDFQEMLPNAKVLEGYTSYEKTASVEEVKKWIEKLDL